MKRRLLVQGAKVTLLSLEIPLLSYVLLYFTYALTRGLGPLSIFLALTSAAVGFAVGCRAFWKLILRSTS